MFVTIRDRVTWRHPEWWVLIVSVVAWLLLIGAAIESPATVGGVHLDHVGMERLAPLTPGGAISAEIAEWMLMVAAMMFPLIVGTIRMTAARSLWSRRDRAIAGLLCGYAIPWLALGASLAVLVRGGSMPQWSGAPWTAAIAFLIAAIWQMTAVRSRAVWRCHRTAPLAPRGWRADWDCIRYGSTIGLHCLVTCWPAMVGCLFAAHSVTAMAGAATIGLAERYVNRPNHRHFAVAFVLLALAVLCLGRP